jgi:CBS domain-containing protein
MRCEEIMSRDVVTLRRDATVQEAARLMAEKDVGFMPVVDGGKAIGVLTDRDIVIRCVAKGNDCGTTKVAEIISKDLVFCSPQDDVSRAKELMQEHKISRILCCDQNRKPVGVISLQDLALEEGASEVGKTVREVKEGAPGPIH